MAGIEQTLTAMTDRRTGLLAERLATTDSRGEWVRRLVLVATAVAILALLWAARLLNQAYTRAINAEAEQRTLAGRLRTSLDSLSQGVAVFGQAHRLRHWNECFQVLLDLPPAMVRTETPYDAFADHFAASGEPLLETEEQITLGQQTGTRRSSMNAPIRTAATSKSAAHPTPDGGFVLTITDMTKRAQSEAVLREAQKMQAIGQLTGGIAHDFNNLLTVIMGNLELARTKLEPAESVGGKYRAVVVGGTAWRNPDRPASRLCPQAAAGPGADRPCRPTCRN